LTFGDDGFHGGRRTREPQEKTLGARKEPMTNSTHIWHWDRIESRSHSDWWEASTAPSLLSKNQATTVINAT